MSKKSNAAVTIAIILLIVMAEFGFPILRFHGNAWIWGGPGFGYQIKMRAIPFNEPGEYVFHFREIPDGTMSLLLYVEGKTGKDREELTDLHAGLDAIFTDQAGTVVCRASAKPGNGPIDQVWALMSGYWGAAFWHSNCVHMPLKRSDSYTLILRVRDVDPNTPKINLLPVIETDSRVWP